MPRIAEYEAPEGLGIRPTETGIESTAAAARRVGGAYSETSQLTKEAGARIGSAVQEAGTVATEYLAKREISQGAAAFAGLMNAKTKQWHDTNKGADPNDPTVAQNYQQSVEADLAKFKSGFLTQAGQDWAEHHIEQLRNHLYAKSHADRATAAGNAVAINAKTTVNGLANAAFWDGTEKGLQTALSSLGTSGLPKPVVEESKEVIIQRAAMGAIKQNAALPDWIQKPEYSKYVDGPTLKGLETAEKQQRHANELQTKQFDIYTKQQNKATVDDAEVNNRNNNTEYDPTANRYTVKPEFFDEAHRISNMPEGRKTGEAMMAWGQRQQDKKPPPVRSDAAVHTDLLERMITPTDNPTTETEIRMAAAKDQLSPQDTHKLIALNSALTKAPIRDPVMNATLNAVKPLLGNDSVGKQNYAAFLQNFIPGYLQLPQAERAGALDFKNPNSFVNRAMSDYQRTPQQKMEQHINDKLGIAPTPTGPAPAPGTPVAVKTAKEAQDLKPGTLYVTPDGQRLIR